MNNRAFLSISTVQILKVICAIVIVIHHTSYYLPNSIFTHIFRPIGYLPVGVFFFISGYGLLYSLFNNPDYLLTFFTKRIRSILIPALTGLTLYFISTKTTFSFNLFFHGALPYSHYWYVVVIFLLYLLFYFIFRFINKKSKGVMIISSLLIIYVGIAGILKIDSYWYNTIFAFPCGMLFSLYENYRGGEILQKKLIFPILLLFLISTSLKYGRANVDNYENIWVLRCTNIPGVMNLITLISSSSLPMLLYCLKLDIKKNIFIKILSSISYEMYLIHNLIVYIYVRYVGFTSIGEVLYIILMVIPVAYILHKINKRLLEINFLKYKF